MKDKHSNSPEKQNAQANKLPPKTSGDDSTVAGQLQQALNLLKPLTDFHGAVEDAGQYDCRLYWDVRLVNGKDTPLRHVHGTSSLPALLAPKMISRATSTIEHEITEKIIAPLIEFFMTEISKTFTAKRCLILNEDEE